MTITRLFAAFLIVLLPSLAQAAAPPRSLSGQDLTDIARAEQYMNDMKTMSARFVQIADNGVTVSGVFMLQRPNRMRLVYDPPSHDYIIADGNFVNIWDGEMQQATSMPIGSSLANVILRDNFKLSGDLTVTHVERDSHVLSISVIDSKEPDQGELTLIFEDNPFLLRQWRVQDAQNRITTVALQDLKSGVDFPSGTFTFKTPNFGKPNKMQ